MNRILFYIKIYFMLFSQYLKTRMQYRSDFFIGTIAIIISNMTGVFSFWVIFKAVSNIKGWNFYELLFIFAFSLLVIAPQELLFDGIWYLRFYLTEGMFIKYYFRPLNIMFYFMSEFSNFKVAGHIIVGLTALVYSSIQLGIQWTAFKILLLLLALFSSTLIITSLMIAAVSIGFWVLDPNSVLNIVVRLKDFTKYPVTIFNSVFKFIFTFIIPLGFVAFYPSQFFLRPEDHSVLVYFSPVIGIVFFMLAYSIWRKGVSVYNGTGS